MSGGRAIYLDNAATSWPKPPVVAEAMRRFLEEVGGNPGRSSHRRAVEAARTVYRARQAVARILGVTDPLRVVFCANATQAINLALRGVLRPGSHVVTTGMEHNAVMRPLRELEKEGVAVSTVPCGADGTLDPDDVRRALSPRTVLIAMTHASNVVGTLLPVAEVAGLAREYGVLLLVDAAQSAGAMPSSVSDPGVDLLAFSGHKALYGPTGTGGLIIGERVDIGRLRPLMWGGTGSRSESERQPDFLPDKYESGTLNVVGLAGLCAGIEWVLGRGVAAVRESEVGLMTELLDGLLATPGVTVYGPRDPRRSLPTVSFRIARVDPGEIGRRLDEEWDIACRVGLHCSPAAHRTLGTYPQGTVRFALGAFSTHEDVRTAVHAVRMLAQEGFGRTRPGAVHARQTRREVAAPSNPTGRAAATPSDSTGRAVATPSDSEAAGDTGND